MSEVQTAGGNDGALSQMDVTYNSLWRLSVTLAKSELIPKHYRDKPANVFIAADYARYTGLPVLSVMRGTYVVHGTLGFSAEFVVARIHQSGKFDEPLSYEEEGSLKAGTYRVRCSAPLNGKRFCGPWVSLAMAQAEGWTKRAVDKRTGKEIPSKYDTMPEVMLGYRAATLFGRRHAPEAMLGVQTVDELEDMAASGQLPRDVSPESSGAARLNAEVAPKADAPGPRTASEVVAEEDDGIVRDPAHMPEPRDEDADEAAERERTLWAEGGAS